MAQNDLVPVDGTVVEVLRDKFVVQTDKGQKIVAYVSGKMRANKIRIVLGDTVTVEVSPYDLSNGRIILRR
jgi:translation initiation factor IF-1